MNQKKLESPPTDFSELLTSLLRTKDFIFLNSPKWGIFSIEKLYDMVLVIIPHCLVIENENYTIELCVDNSRVTRIISKSKNNKGALSIREDEVPQVLRQKIRNLSPVSHLKELLHNFNPLKGPPDEIESLETGPPPPKEVKATIIETIQKIRNFFGKMI